MIDSKYGTNNLKENTLVCKNAAHTNVFTSLYIIHESENVFKKNRTIWRLA